MTVAISSREQAVWQLFADWCDGLGYSALPADSIVLARFIAANPASVATQRRRVGVINAVHSRVGHRPPGRAETIRDLLDTRRATRTHLRAVAAADAIGRLPADGWPTAVFARRDAMLLVLASAAIPSACVAALRVGDIAADPGADGLRITAAGEMFTTPATLPTQGVRPVRVLQDWLRIRSIQYHLPSTRSLAAYLCGDPIPAVGPAPENLPLVTPIDRWGAIPLIPESLSAASISRIVTAHLNGSSRPHRPITVRSATEAETIPVLPPAHSPMLDPASFSRGVAARARAAKELDNVAELLDDVEDRADRLLADLLLLLDGPDVAKQSGT
jgi:hypothetical protein